MRRWSFKIRQFRSAMALVAVLWVIVLMMVLVSVAAQTSLLDSRVSQVENEKQRCRWACRAGLETAVALLLEDDRAYDGLTDMWADNPQELEDIDLGGVTLTIKIIDAASRLNVNTVSQDQLLSLPDMTADIVAGIQDWIDSDDTVRDGGAESSYYMNLQNQYWSRNAPMRTTREVLRVKGVTEGLFYGDAQQESLSAENEGWIQYLTCWSQEINQDSTGTTRVNVNRANAETLRSQLGVSEAQARWITENRSFRTLAELMGKSTSSQSSQTSTTAQVQPSQQPQQTGQQSSQQQSSQQQPPQQQSPQQPSGQTGQRASGQQTGQQGRQQQTPSEPLNWQTLLEAADKISMTNRRFIRGKLNVNTAGLEVLTAFFDGNRELAQNLMNARQGQGGAFMSLSELQKADGMSQDILKQKLDMLTIRSSVFEIQATAVSEATGLKYSIEAIVNRDASQGQVYYWREGIAQ